MERLDKYLNNPGFGEFVEEVLANCYVVTATRERNPSNGSKEPKDESSDNADKKDKASNT